jgi:hypothetical protein
MEFTSDPIGSDGIIRDKITQKSWPTEHVLALKQEVNKNFDLDTLILNAIEQKRTKGGAAYASGKILVVFLETPTDFWYPNIVVKKLPNPLYFTQVWVINLQCCKDETYTYNVVLLENDGTNAPSFQVSINKDFDSWEIMRVQ